MIGHIPITLQRYVWMIPKKGKELEKVTCFTLSIGGAHGLGMAEFLPLGWATEDCLQRAIHYAFI